MFNKLTPLLFAAALGAPLANAQFNFDVDGKTVQIHSFFSQGFADSDDNNFLTMKTAHLRTSSEWEGRSTTAISATWATGIRSWTGPWRTTGFKDWFGVRGGKVKTVLGLYTDSQDADFLHTWVLLPQSAYPLDLRSTYPRTSGAMYMDRSRSGKLDSLSYTGYYGLVPYDKYGGFACTFADAGLPVNTFTSSMEGGVGLQTLRVRCLPTN
jgi:hypothetical protein